MGPRPPCWVEVHDDDSPGCRNYRAASGSGFHPIPARRLGVASAVPDGRPGRGPDDRGRRPVGRLAEDAGRGYPSRGCRGAACPPGRRAAGRDIRAVAEAAASAGTAVVVETAWASNPAVAQLARAIAGRLPDITLIDSVAQVPDDHRGPWADVLLDQVILLRAVTGPLDAVRFAVQDVHGYTVDGVQGASTVAMAAVRSPVSAPIARLAAYGVTAEAHLLVPAGARPHPLRRASWTGRRCGPADVVRDNVSDVVAAADPRCFRDLRRISAGPAGPGGRHRARRGDR